VQFHARLLIPQPSSNLTTHNGRSAVISRLTSLSPAASPAPAALRSALRRSGSVLLVVPTRRISQKDVSKAADAAADAALRRDFERHGLKFAVPASLKYNDEREGEREKGKKSFFLQLFSHTQPVPYSIAFNAHAML
jgi:hypothetical protein